MGSALAHRLEDRGHQTAVIDADPDAFRRLGPAFRGSTVVGKGFDRAVLLQAGIERADAFAAVSSGDNSNIIAARVAREQFAVANVIARIYDADRAEVYERLGIPTIATVPWAADQMLRRILPAGSEPAWRDPSGHLEIDAVYAPREWIGRTVAEVERTGPIRVAYLTRLGQGTMVRGETVVQQGDVLSLVVADDDGRDIIAAFSGSANPPHPKVST